MSQCFLFQDQKYELLKSHAEEKLEEANKEIDNISRSQVGLGKIDNRLMTILGHYK